MKKRFLFPAPQKVAWREDCCRLAPPLDLPGTLDALDTVCPGCYRFGGRSDVDFTQDASLPAQGYVLEVGPAHIRVASADDAGRFHALVTLGQLLAAGGALPCCRVEDAPSLATRGFLLDVGRGRIPTLDTLYRLADLLAGMKYDQLQLYMEGFCFDYPSFPACLEGHIPLTGAELESLDAYCAARHIELVPCQNSLGHMAPWLARSEFRHLAEREEGLELFGRTFPPTTLNVSDPESLELAVRMMDDLTPHFTSRCINMGLDEAFELGQGKNAALAAEIGRDALFLRYVTALHRAVAARGRKMMMWDDGAVGSPLLRRELPEDILFLEWGYEAEHPFEERARCLQQAGRPFLVCPGTSSWSSFTGITDNMLTNIRSAVGAGVQYGAEGMLLTDWGDMGHLQPPAVSFPGILFAGALAWNPASDPDEAALASALDRFVYRAPDCGMGAFALAAGRYCRREEFPMACRTLACLPILLGPMDAEKYRVAVPRFCEAMARMAPPPLDRIYLEKLKELDGGSCGAVLAETERLLDQLERARPACPDAGLIKREYRCALETVRALTEARRLLAAGERSPILGRELARLVTEYRAIRPLRATTDRLEEDLAGLARLRDHFGA